MKKIQLCRWLKLDHLNVLHMEHEDLNFLLISIWYLVFLSLFMKTLNYACPVL